MAVKTLTPGLLLVLGLAGAPLVGQEAPMPQALGAIAGRVLDAGTGAPVADADVELRHLPTDGATGGGRGQPAGGLAGTVVGTVITDADGAYRFEAVGPGRYRITAERVGYAPRTVTVYVGSRDGARVSVALDVEPIVLRPVTVEVPGGSPLPDPGDRSRFLLGRTEVVRARQERYLTTDSRVVAAPDIAEAATLGQPDVFRALQRLPGVSTRDDYSAELWTRGADWGETRVYLDGLPLFNPVHGFGVLSGVSSRAVSTATLHAGVRDVALPEGGAAVVDLLSASRAPPGAERSGAVLTLASAETWAAGSLPDSGGWRITARRSWVDAAASAASRDPGDSFPYRFWDLHLSGDVGVGGGHRLSVTGLLERDDIGGELPDLLHNTTATWGNVLGLVALEGPLSGGLNYRVSAGATAYDASVSRIEGTADSLFSAPSERPADHTVGYLKVSGALTPADGSRRWQVGYDLVSQRARYAGPAAWPYSQVPPDLASVHDTTRVVRLALWGGTRWRPAAPLTVDAGLRVAGGTAVGDGQRVDLSPYAVARVSLTDWVGLVAAGGVYTQYAQSPAPVGPRVETVLQTGRRWVLAGNRPPVRAMLATLGGEAWLGPGWVASATGYWRRSTGLLLPDPTPGALVQRPPLVQGRATARGLDLSLRRLAGRVTGSVGYSWSRTRATALGRTFAAPTDRRHTFDVGARTRLGGPFHLSTAFTFASGAPFTRVLPCSGAPCGGLLLDRPFGRRGPAYSSLDVVLDAEHRFGRWRFGWFVQGRNVLHADNAVSYQSSHVECPGGIYEGEGCFGGGGTMVDRFVSGIPTLPLLGLRVSFR